MGKPDVGTEGKERKEKIHPEAASFSFLGVCDQREQAPGLAGAAEGWAVGPEVRNSQPPNPPGTGCVPP